MTTIFFAIITVLRSRPESIVNMAMMQSIPTTQVKTNNSLNDSNEISPITR